MTCLVQELVIFIEEQCHLKMIEMEKILLLCKFVTVLGFLNIQFCLESNFEANLNYFLIIKTLKSLKILFCSLKFKFKIEKLIFLILNYFWI